ncbi:hypothetical protein [Burkholderia multivorans]|uniref:hypothetical protein n=1 Tax=Burkholderia multivorans TaxID=87883 RepID=UPI003734CEB4
MSAPSNANARQPSNARRHADATLRALKAELREAEAYYTRHHLWAEQVKSMSAEQVEAAWETAEPWQRRILAIRALAVDPMLREEFDLLRDPFGKSDRREYQQPSAALARMLAALADKPPYRHPCVISRDIMNVSNERLCN